jgi:hypothetical protein
LKVYGKNGKKMKKFNDYINESTLNEAYGLPDVEIMQKMAKLNVGRWNKPVVLVSGKLLPHSEVLDVSERHEYLTYAEKDGSSGYKIIRNSPFNNKVEIVYISAQEFESLKRMKI